ncbi:pyridine nucleotide-disulfide oxidoreductase [Steroidobacter denitrificans]|uniref:Pyridine nucleotide-disulfide oxidoreductase n=1 Tax=Steroidobacter denitrificans TaxID=465721 RepID=A0A127F8V4_STEDE|nr:apoptosis inducing factor family protein [Steroidobacter denitrificans]AMN45969.1 pyridine nucleotide-disulfide oxidoreductase [Steroidobacter denitrificans]
MSAGNSHHAGPDLAAGVVLADLPDGGKLAGHVGDHAVLLVRRGSDVFAVDALCTHYHGPLAEGLVVGDTVRCPWHHACFDLRTGEALRAPALSPLACWSVEQRDGRLFVRGQRAQSEIQPFESSAETPARIVIVGGGAAGFAAAERLRREGYQGDVVMLSNDDAAPVDRPNLSKDYLAGAAPEDWVPLRPESYYAQNGIDLRLQTEVVHIDPLAREIGLADGGRQSYDRLLLATGAEPVRLMIPGADQPHVRSLRSLADCRAIIERAIDARRAVIVGASFIGLEVAAALRARDIEVHVVAPDKRPMERVLGAQIGDFVRALHEQHGVIFHLEETVTAIDGRRVLLSGGGTLEADLVVVGIGVKPRTELAEAAGIRVERGVLVNEYLETSLPGIFAAGDIARWPDPHTGEIIRVEHWVVAQRQGQTAAVNMLGRREKYTAVPFFWTQHYDVPINYVGHAEQWDRIIVEGDIGARDCLLHFNRGNRTLAVASIFRDLNSLQAEVEMEQRIAATADQLK